VRKFLIILFFSIGLLGCGRWGMAFRPNTNSMAPTLDTEDMCKADPFAYSNHPIERFDIVVYQAPEEIKKRFGKTGDILFIKRVIGLPGERIEIRNNELYVNEQRVDEPYEIVKDENDRKKNFGPITVASDEYFILGDNRPGSEDSRYYAHPTIKRGDIYSKVTEIYPDYYAKK
jgi:signal peptidase I